MQTGNFRTRVLKMKALQLHPPSSSSSVPIQFSILTLSFVIFRAQRVHQMKLESIAGRKAAPRQHNQFSVDDQERFFRNKQRIHSYKQSGRLSLHFQEQSFSRCSS